MFSSSPTSDQIVPVQTSSGEETLNDPAYSLHPTGDMTPVEIAMSSDEAKQENLLTTPQEDDKLLPVIGLGGSAGGIPALQRFFKLIPTDLGIAYVVVLHLLPGHESALPQIIQKQTAMPVVQVQTRTELKPDHIYVIPPNYHLAMRNGYLHLTEPQQERGKRVAVDLFFRTLATSHRSKAIAVVLSGTDGDGAIGIKLIKEQGGVTVVQDPEEAEYDGMPRAAIETGMVDWILSVSQMAEKFAEFIRNERKIHLPPSEHPSESISLESEEDNAKNRDNVDEVALREVLAFLRARTEHDFTHYKRATVLRRIMRRLQVNSLDSIPSYANFLRTHPGEAGALLQDLLISVTNFFRDPDSFWSLSSHIPQLFQGKGVNDSLRIWVPGCATGEEAYSIAMLLLEYCDTVDTPPEIQIFATDLDDTALRFAREGTYPATISADVSAERLRRFFVLDQGRYSVKKEVRERILFAPHNVLKDSPFSRLDLISCRNLMIYFDRLAQDRVLGLFHFALRPTGLLFLGNSESAEDNSLFTAVDKKHRIYERQGVSRSHIPLPTIPLPTIPQLNVVSPLLKLKAIAPPDPMLPTSVTSESGRTLSHSELHLRLLEESAPPSILVNHNYEILHLSQHAGRYLRFHAGEASMDLLSMLPPALRLELRVALFRAIQGGETVEVPGISIDLNGKTRIVGAKVRPMRSESTTVPSAFVLVIFQEHELAEEEEPNQPLAPEPIATQLEAELQHLKAYLRASIDQYEASSEELRASNEELQAMNEEQRSASEELETSREEIQAANEELITLNVELKCKVEEISRANSDLQNLMGSTDIATIFLSRDLRIKRYTPRAVDLFSLISTDLGRPLSDLRHPFVDEKFNDCVSKVVQTLMTDEQEVSTKDGRWFLLRISPYRTSEDKIDGIVLTFLDITRRRRAEDEVRHARKELEERVEERTKELSEVMEKRRFLEEERKHLTQRIVLVQEEERQRISRELHDNMGQQLMAINMSIHSLQNLIQRVGSEETSSPLSAEMAHLQQMVDDLTHITHHLAWELRPAILDNLGLEAALREYVNDWTKKNGISAGLASNISPSKGRLPNEVSTALYRVVQEALTNILRHAQASQVSVILNQSHQLITVVVEDNGKGFDAESNSPLRLGVLGMHERMALVGGTLQIESSPGIGTTVYARVPLSSHNIEDKGAAQ